MFCTISSDIIEVNPKPIASPLDLRGPYLTKVTGFDSLNDDTLHLILLFAGKKSFIPCGVLNKRCNQIFLTHNIPKETFLYGYAPLPLIKEKVKSDGFCSGRRLGKAIVYYNRNDILQHFVRLIEDEGTKENKLSWATVFTVRYAYNEGRMDILAQVENCVGEDFFCGARTSNSSLYCRLSEPPVRRLSHEEIKFYYGFGLKIRVVIFIKRVYCLCLNCLNFIISKISRS